MGVPSSKKVSSVGIDELNGKSLSKDGQTTSSMGSVNCGFKVVQKQKQDCTGKKVQTVTAGASRAPTILFSPCVFKNKV